MRHVRKSWKMLVCAETIADILAQLAGDKVPFARRQKPRHTQQFFVVTDRVQNKR